MHVAATMQGPTPPAPTTFDPKSPALGIRGFRLPVSVALVVLLLASVSSSLGAQSIGLPALVPGQHFGPGEIVESRATGLRFRIPAGFEGRVDPESELFLISGGTRNAAVWAYSQGALEDVADVMGADLEELGVFLTVDELTGGDDWLRGAYHSVSELGFGRLHGMVRRGPEGNVVGVAALGGQGEDEVLRTLVEDVLATVEWASPTAGSWATGAAGSRLTSSSEEGAADNDPSNPGAYTRQSYAEIRLCRDGSYAYLSEGVAFFSSQAGSVSSERRDSHEGHWSLVADLLGHVWLSLEPWDREEVIYQVEVTENERVLLGKNPYDVDEAGC